MKAFDSALGDLPSVVSEIWGIWVQLPTVLKDIEKVVRQEQQIIGLCETKAFDVYMYANRAGTPIGFYDLEQAGLSIWRPPGVVKIPYQVYIKKYNYSIGQPSPPTPAALELAAPLIPWPDDSIFGSEGSSPLP